MGRISTYMQVSMDGYFAGTNGEIDWFKNNPDPEFEGVLVGARSRRERPALRSDHL